MDRFIGKENEKMKVTQIDLKSNMDRFIALLHNTNGFGTKRFKIQYG